MAVTNILCMRAAVILAVILSFAIGLVSGCATHSAAEDKEGSLSRQGLSENHIPKTNMESSQAIPEGGFTWRQLKNLAVAINPDYAVIAAKARAEYFRYKSRTDLRDPQFLLDYSFLSDTERRNQFGADIRFYIPNPFVNKQELKTGEAARREKETETETLKNEIASIIYELTREILIGEQELSILILREQVLSDWENHLKMRFDVNMATQADMREFDIQRLRLKTSVRQVQFKINAARKSLQALVQIPDEQIILNPVPTDWEKTLEQFKDEKNFIEDVLSRSPELSAANFAYEKACASLNAARAKQIPWFESLDLSYSPSYSDRLYSQNKWTFGFRMNLPVFIWFSSEKKTAEAEIEAASLKIKGIQNRIRDEVTGIISDLHDSLLFLIDYRSSFNTIPEPTRQTIPNQESYFKLLDAWLSSSEYALKIEQQCAYLYGQMIKVAGEWE